MMFDREIDRVLSYVARGLGVKITGMAGSGRTTVAKEVAARLEALGTKTVSVHASPSMSTVPFAGIHSLGLDLPSRPVGVLGMTDLVAGAIARTRVKAIVIDNADALDRETANTIDTVHRRLGIPVVFTSLGTPFLSGASPTSFGLGDWPYASVRIPPLRFEQVSELITEMLGAPGDVDLTAAVFSKSGGNLRLAARIIETGLLDERLAFVDGLWRLTAPLGVNEHLNVTIEGLLRNLTSEQARALSTVAMLGTAQVDELSDSIHPDILDALEHRGLLSAARAADGKVLVSVFPPAVEDYLRTHVKKYRKVLHSSVSGAFPVPGERDGRPERTSSTAFEDLRSEMEERGDAMVRRYQSTLQSTVESRYREWNSDRTVARAAAFLKACWGASIDAARVEEVFERTDRTVGDNDGALLFSLTESLWYVQNRGDFAAARDCLRRLGNEQPALVDDVEAWALFLEATYDRMPDDLDERLTELSARGSASPVIAVVKGILETYRLNPEAAIAAIQDADESSGLPPVRPLIRSLALYERGRVDEALTHALEHRRAAMDQGDAFSLVALSYAAALSLIHKGKLDEAEYALTSAIALGRPGLLVNSLFSALLRLSSLRQGSAASVLGAQAGSETRAVGALPGTGKGLYELIVRRHDSIEEFDQSASQLVDEQLRHGYIFEAMYTARFALCLLPGRRLHDLYQRIANTTEWLRDGAIARIAAAVIASDVYRVRRILDSYEPDDDAVLVLGLLRGAARRYRFEGKQPHATHLELFADEFAAKHRLSAPLVDFDLKDMVTALTLREVEIARMAGNHSNPEIAAELGVSVRTVESHISHAMRKTKTKSRKQLSVLVETHAKSPSRLEGIAVVTDSRRPTRAQAPADRRPDPARRNGAESHDGG